MLNKIAQFIRKNGTLVNQAKSAWGADVWVLGDYRTTIEDDGYTTSLSCEKLGSAASITGDYGICYRKGDAADLEKLFAEFAKNYQLPS